MSDRLPLLLQAAWLYYEDGLTQAEIAEQLSVSRATVGRILEEARQRGVVTFQFHSDRLHALSLSQEVRDTLRLRNALVIPDLGAPVDQKAINERVARGAAQYLGNHLNPEVTLAIGWGDTVSRTLAALRYTSFGELTLVTMSGGANAYIEAILNGLETHSNSLRVRANVLPAPIIASSPQLAQAIGDEAEVQRTLRACIDAPYALVGVGTPAASSTLMELGYVDEAELTQIATRGAVGDILGQFFNEEGDVVDVPIHDRRIGIDISTLRGRKNVVGVAGGLEKVDAILGAVAGGYLDVLVTDEATARHLLSRHAEHH
jgi:lsr operon transcriptional repressor